MKNKVLVTGATGYIGSNLCRKLLEENFKVYILTRVGSKYDYLVDIKDRINIFVWNEDINNLIKFFKSSHIECVFHLASYVKTDHLKEDVSSLIASNILYGSKILEAMKHSGIRFFINTGTYWQNYNSEDYNPVDLYAATKEAFEKIIKYYVEAENIRCITLKLFDTFGENDRRPKLINLLDQLSRERGELKLSPGEQKLDLVHINTVARSFIKAYYYLVNNEAIKNEVYGVSSGKLKSLKEIISEFESKNEKHLNIIWGARAYRKREIMIPIRTLKMLPEDV